MNKQSTILNLNNILLSALSDSENNGLKELLISENESILPFVEEQLAEDFKKNVKYSVKPEDEPALIDALMSIKQSNYAQAFYDFVRLWKDNPDNLEVKKSICICLINLKAYKFVVEYFVQDLEEYIDTDDEVIKIIAGAYYGIPEYYEKAIPLYEKLLERQTDE
ncbi:MAG: hypothetical protein NC200_08110, partial [Candidatus Gastranaerophilales bacterium]|nr:hypothetical protein [Candidatus Gastranaerophilales bacterium]